MLTDENSSWDDTDYSLTADTLAQHLNLDADQDHKLLARYLQAAKTWCASYTGTTSDMPNYQQAVLMLAAHFYENREASLIAGSSYELPLGVKDLLAPFRSWSF